MSRDRVRWQHGDRQELDGGSGAQAAETLAVKQVGFTEATLAGTVDPKGVATTFHFEYGTTEAYGSSITEHVAETDEEERATVHDLTPGMTYHFRIVATNSYGTTYGDDRTFSTGIEPFVQTDAAANVGSTGATLGGTVNPHGTEVAYYFEYGVAPGYGSSTAQTSVGAGSSDVDASQTIAGLSPGVTYHYRLVAVYGSLRCTAAK